MRRLEIRRSACCAAALAALCGAIPSKAVTQPGDAFLCYRARTARGTPRFNGATVGIADEQQTRQLALRRPRLLCAPIDLGGGVLDPDTSLVGYTAGAADGAPYQAAADVQVLNQLGELYADRAAAPTLLLAPAAIQVGAPPTPPDPDTNQLDHFRCHDAQPLGGARAFEPGQQVTVQDRRAQSSTR